MSCRLLFIAAIGLILVGCGSRQAVEIINRCPPEPPEIICPVIDITEPKTLSELRKKLAELRFTAGACKALSDAWLEAWKGC